MRGQATGCRYRPKKKSSAQLPIVLIFDSELHKQIKSNAEMAERERVCLALFKNNNEKWLDLRSSRLYFI
jgi:hypothetical protein